MSIVIDFLQKRRSTLLLGALVALQIASPLADGDPHAGAVIAILVLLVLLAGASYMANRRLIRLLVIPLTGIWLLARAVEAFGAGRHIYTHLAPAAGLMLSCAVLWAMLDRFRYVPLVTGDVISEAFICYLTIAIAFSQVYWILNQLVDNAFSEPFTPAETSGLLYFSMITLITEGYGRIVPLNPYVRIVAALEGMVGVFYIAVVVARLVSSYRHQASDDPPEQCKVRQASIHGE